MAEHYMRDVPMSEMVPPPVVPAEPPHPLDALLPEFASFMDMVKVDFAARGLWTEYDQGLRDRITAYNLAKLKSAAIVGGPRHSMRPAQRPDVKAAAEAEGLRFVGRSHGLTTTETVSLDTLTNIVRTCGLPLRDGNTPPPSHAPASSSETGQQENGNG